MTTHVTVVYEPMSDRERFMQRYRDEHVPLATEAFRSFGLVKWHLADVSDELGGDGETAPALMVTLVFDAPVDEVVAGLATPGSQEVYEHALSLTDAPVRTYVGPGEEVPCTP